MDCMVTSGGRTCAERGGVRGGVGCQRGVRGCSVVTAVIDCMVTSGGRTCAERGGLEGVSERG